MVNHTARNQINAREPSVESDVKGRNMDLGKVHIHFLRPMYSRNSLSIDNRKLQLRSEQLIDAAICCTGIDQGRQADHWQGRGRVDGGWIVSGIEADIDVKRRASANQQIATKDPAGSISEATFSACHSRGDT